MRYFFIILALLNVFYCKAQGLPKDVIAIFIKEKSMAKVLANPVIVKRKMLVGFPSHGVDSIDFDVKVYTDSWAKDITTSKWSDFNWMFLYSRHDTIFYVKVVKGDSKRESVTLFLKLDTVMLLQFVAQHNKKYFSSWTLTDFSNQIFQLSSYSRWGFFNGRGKANNNAYAIAKLVKEKSLDKLKSLASSFSAYDRAFGTAGLYFLILKGEKLSKGLIDLIEVNKASKIQISYMLYDHGGITTIGDVLGDEGLNYIYLELKRLKVLES